MPTLARIIPPTAARRALASTPCLHAGKSLSWAPNLSSHAIIPLPHHSNTAIRSATYRAGRHRRGSAHGHKNLSAFVNHRSSGDSFFTSLHNVFRSILERRYQHTSTARPVQRAPQSKRSFRSCAPSLATERELCRDCETAHVQTGGRFLVSRPQPSLHVKKLRSLEQKRHQHHLVQDTLLQHAPDHSGNSASAKKVGMGLKEKAQSMLDLYYHQDFHAALQMSNELQTSLQHQKCKPFTLEQRIRELELFRYCCRLEQWAMAKLSAEEHTKILQRIVQLHVPAPNTGSNTPLEAALRLNHQHNTTLIFESEGDPIITRAFGLLGTHLSTTDLSHPAAQVLLQLVDQSVTLQLLPDRTSTVLQHNPRIHVLDFLFAQHEAERAMAWIWLWDNVDTVDWRQQVVTDQQRMSLRQRFIDAGREDFVLDVSRMLNKSYIPLTGIGNSPDGAGEFKSGVRLFGPESVASCFDIARHHEQPLLELLRLHQLDKDSFGSKGFLYGDIQASKRLDLFCSWTEGILAQRSLKSRAVRARPYITESPESLLWREMAMVGMLSSELVVEDIVRATGVTRYDLVNTPGGNLDNSERLYQDSLVVFMENLPATDARSLLCGAIQRLMSPTDVVQPSSKTDDYRLLLQGIVHQVVTRLQHRGLISHTLELKFRGVYAHDEALLGRVESAVRRWRAARAGLMTNQAKHRGYRQNHHLQRSHPSNSPQVQSFLSSVIEPSLARMCAIAAMQAKSSGATLGKDAPQSTSSSDFFSEWLTTVAEWSPRAGPMLRFLDTPTKRLLPTTTAYRVALHSLLQGGELDMAAALHFCAYNLVGASVEQTDKKKQHHFPSNKELGQLVDRLTHDKDISHIEQAQWIVNQHLERERRRKELSFPGRHTDINFSSQCVDTAIISSLIRGWIAHGNFARVQEQVQTMQKLQLEPNKFFYSAFLKALVDLEPTIHNGQLVGGGDGQARQVGRRIAIQHMLEVQHLEDRASTMSPAPPLPYVPTATDEGWRILFQIIRDQEERHVSHLCRHSGSAIGGWSSADPNNFDKDPLGGARGAETSSTGLDRMKSLVHQMVRAISHGGNDSHPVYTDPDANDTQEGSRFQPNLHIFSILLDAYSRRGNTEAILELLADMSKIGVEPNEVVYTVVANAFAKRKNLRAMDQVIREAEQSGVDTGLYMHNIALNTLVRMQASPDKVHNFIQRMVRITRKKQDGDSLANSVDHPCSRTPSTTTTTTTTAFSDDMSYQPLHHPLQQGLDQVTLSTLMNYHVKRRDIDSAEQILRAMTSAGFIPEKGVYYLVLGACIQQHRTLVGLDLLHLMRAHAGYVPDARAWKGLLTCALEEQAWLDREQYRRLRQNRRAHDSLKHGRDQQQQQQQQSNALGDEEGKEEKEEERMEVRSAESTAPRKMTRNTPAAESDSLVVQVLRGMWATVEKLEAHDAMQPLSSKERVSSPSLCRGKKSLQEQYVREVFASSAWMTLDQVKMEQEIAAWMEGKTNTRLSPSSRTTVDMLEFNDGKGRHSLLRRILDHLLQDGHRPSAIARQDMERRCHEALWVIQQVEQHGLLMGDKWKWLVVGRRIEQLVNWDPRQIKALLDSANSGPK